MKCFNGEGLGNTADELPENITYFFNYISKIF
jgi:hypothetical protein